MAVHGLNSDLDVLHSSYRPFVESPESSDDEAPPQFQGQGGGPGWSPPIRAGAGWAPPSGHNPL
jgi:hypothetical protein